MAAFALAHPYLTVFAVLLGLETVGDAAIKIARYWGRK